MRIGIVTNVGIDEAVELTRRLLAMLGEHEVILGPEISKKLGSKSSERELKETDVVLTVGGDGTVLRAHRLAPEVPILGINVGGRGFLAEVDPRESEEAVRKLLEGKMEITERKKLSSRVGAELLPDALNDVVVVTSKPGKAISLEVGVGSKPVWRFRGDGLIAASPTGSTAYSKAAGGPILDPEVEGFVLVPICPSAPPTPSLVVPSGKDAEVRVGKPGGEALIVIDGKSERKLGIGEAVRISISTEPAKFLYWKNFYQKLGEKLL